MKEIKKVGIFINTPAQFHFYKNIINELKNNGIAAAVVYRDYGETKTLVEEGNRTYFEYSHKESSFLIKGIKVPMDIFRACRYLKKEKVDLITGFGLYDCISSSLLGVPCIVFNDSEPYVNLVYSFYFKTSIKFADVVVTPNSFNQDLGPKQIRVNSPKETAYLHPKYFKPDKSILNMLHLDEKDCYAILRFNSFDAVHDTGITGFDNESKIELVRRLSPRMNVFISSEGNLDPSLLKYQIKIPKNRIHDAIYFASLVVADTQTIATEAAILGTPVIRYNAFVGANDMGIFNELEARRLLYNYNNKHQAIDKAEEISIDCRKFKAEWVERSNQFSEENVSLTEYMCNLIMNYYKDT